MPACRVITVALDDRRRDTRREYQENNRTTMPRQSLRPGLLRVCCSSLGHARRVRRQVRTIDAVTGTGDGIRAVGMRSQTRNRVTSPSYS